MIGIDTFSWYKILQLKKGEWKELVETFLKYSQFFITYEVKEELDYRFPQEQELFKLVAILPKLEIDFNDYRSKGFDDADASLLEYSKRRGHTIITEDHLMLEEGIKARKNIIQLADYFGILWKYDVVTNQEFYHLVKSFRQMKNITKKKEADLLKMREEQRSF